MNVLDFAMQMEADGKAHYERLAAECEEMELRNLFTLLAEAEQSHYDALLARKNDAAFARMESRVLEHAKNIFQRLLQIRDQRALATDVDGYRQVVKAEEDSISFYRDAARKEQAVEVRSLLQSLAEEEKIHLNIVENIYEFVESPKFFLAWREFSNLKEL
jgi:rubrerythrin